MTDSVTQEAAGEQPTVRTGWPELCRELVDNLQEARDAVADWAAYVSDYFQQKHDLQGELDRINRRLDRARAALAQPEPEVVGLTVISKECRQLLTEAMDIIAEEWGHTRELESGRPFDPTSVSNFLERARAVLARFGNHSPGAAKMVSPAPAPAEGDVWDEARYLVRELRDQADDLSPSFELFGLIHRAADLLAQCHPESVPETSGVYYEFVVSDADSCTQAGGIAPTYAQALSEGQHYLAQYQQDGPHTLELRRVEVLNPDALPLPAGEVQP